MTELTQNLNLESIDSTEFYLDVISGLSSKAKTLPSKYFYDEQGSLLFDQICDLDEYYITRTESQIMDRYAHDMARTLGEKIALIELGSGSSRKTRLLLDEVSESSVYMPVDISREHLYKSAEQLAFDFPDLTIKPIHADFTQPIKLDNEVDKDYRKVVYFPGSTIGNFEPDKAVQLLNNISNLVDPDGGLLIGYDLIKDLNILEDAYNDSAGVTAAFNKNLLQRINQELEGDIDLDAFEHQAIYNPEEHRIEMHLISQEEQLVHIGESTFHFEKQESICTEYSHKYSMDSFRQMAQKAGFHEDRCWTDPNQYFAICYYRL
ncbi:L-histidine N(alpha)-methyltransferase [Rubinisphaera sp.]|uniref:L-histidine N(alpha)-methyltransferase n=1 Tax=Rubinisphaera sp. TaxID=2024857 RepID=UPI000C0D1F83|nr:L-histidine N(alpha)-methyltransferase [Rubinisphaera sp.]MBV10689.1 L-histidine N(alpha)-methyltransferase [Rubinisphaera sp.]HCS52419.1 L-histidine N(alpha)-methyltransferase [Planctomycetaceae bacterium]|tara:strand:+ start:4891 stop:5853 length:963 start_codon:yes stop_codon:yes gene_type:complete